MKNKGFTLVELLAVIAILGLLAVIVTPKVVNLISDSEEALSKQQVKQVVDATKKYMLEHSELLPDETGGPVMMAVNELVLNGIINSDVIINPKTKEEMRGCVIVSYSNDYNQYVYDYSETCLENTKYDFAFVGNYQEFVVPLTGYYRIEAWGAKGGDSGSHAGGLGAYTSGDIYLRANTSLYVYVGGSGTTSKAGYNGGGSPMGSYPGGGGATDIRYFSSKPSDSDLKWDSTNGLKARVMVAGAGGGSYYFSSSWNSKAGDAGGLIGYAGEYYNTCETLGGTQTGAGTCSNHSGQDGGFGTGGNGSNGLSVGGGSGYYGGAGRFDESGSSSGGGGGSSYISGHTGCVAVGSNGLPLTDCDTGTTDKSCSIHFSNLSFKNTVMIDGKGYEWTNVIGNKVYMPSYSDNSKVVGNNGDGHVRITFIGIDL